MAFPAERGRRVRASESLRRLVREARLGVDDLVWPLFVVPGRRVEEPVASMPGVFQRSVDRVAEAAAEAWRLAIPGVILFGVPERKDAQGSEASAPEGVVQQAVRAIKDRVPDLAVVTDVCLCEYTDHGHCGVLRDGKVDNDASLERLAAVALSHVQAGADMVAPSDMMDGRVGVVRRRLDAEGFAETPILSYAAKYASAFYGPFRDAAYSAPRFGDRRSYQMDPPNAREALREVRLDIEEGADIVMVKPALSCLDVLRRVRDAVDVPVAAYNVSGEYSMIRAAAAAGWIDERAAVLEVLTAIRRAGADFVLTYFAPEVARWVGA